MNKKATRILSLSPAFMVLLGASAPVFCSVKRFVAGGVGVAVLGFVGGRIFKSDRYDEGFDDGFGDGAGQVKKSISNLFKFDKKGDFDCQLESMKTEQEYNELSELKEKEKLDKEKTLDEFIKLSDKFKKEQKEKAVALSSVKDYEQGIKGFVKETEPENKDAKKITDVLKKSSDKLRSNELISYITAINAFDKDEKIETEGLAKKLLSQIMVKMHALANDKTILATVEITENCNRKLENLNREKDELALKIAKLKEELEGSTIKVEIKESTTE